MSTAKHSDPRSLPGTARGFPRKHSDALALLALAVILALLFARSFVPGWSVAGGDEAFESIRRANHDLLPYGYVARWLPEYGLGSVMAPLYMTPGFWLAFLTSPGKYGDANYILHLFLLGGLSYFLLKDITGGARAAAFTGAIFMMLQPRVFSHMLPGHLGYFQLIGWLPGAFWLLRKAVRGGYWPHWGLVGGFMGIGLANGGTDVGLFFTLLLGFYGAFLVIVRMRTARRAGGGHGPAVFAARAAGGIACACIVAFLLSYQALGAALSQARLQSGEPEASPPEATADARTQSADESWFWATQWSVPLEETLDFGIPGFFGWGSSNPANPYRGRIGQTEGYAGHGQGLPNLNDVSNYMGAVMLLAALLAAVYRRRDGETWFWLAAALTACLLAYGKHAPFYRWFYALPYMDTMRNPIKWLYIASFSVGILGTRGLAETFRRAASPAEGGPRSRLRLGALLAAPGLVFVAGGIVFLLAQRANPDALFFWRQPGLAGLSARAVGIAAVFWAAAATLYYWMLRPAPAHDGRRAKVKSGARPAFAGCVLLAVLLLAELIYVNIHYRPYYRTRTRVTGGALADLIGREERPFRIRVLGGTPPMQYIRQALAPHYEWEQAELATARTLADFHRLQEAVGRDIVRFLQLTNVRFAIAPARIPVPELQPVLSLQSGEHAIEVHRFTGELPRYFVVPRWRIVPEEQRFTAVAERRFDPAAEVLIHAPADIVPALPDAPAREVRADILRYDWHRIKLRVSADAPAMLVGLDRYHPAWRAFIDGQPTPLFQANAMLRAVPVPAGEHVVELRLIGDGPRPLIVVGAGWLALLVCGTIAFRRRNNLSS